jgi:hypothetical protein
MEGRRGAAAAAAAAKIMNVAVGTQQKSKVSLYLAHLNEHRT